MITINRVDSTRVVQSKMSGGNNQFVGLYVESNRIEKNL
jgi:hypothetical protein